MAPPIPLNLTPATELDAVNMMLQSIGQAPVNSLAVSGVKDVNMAQLALHNTSREVQTRGWWFNTETEVSLLPAADGTVAVPVNALETVPSDVTKALTVRAGKLYDLKAHTATFPAGIAVLCDVKLFLAFEDIPQAARDYIALRAARIFQANIIGSQILYQFDAQHEAEARAEMLRADLRGQDTNMFRAPNSNNLMLRRS